MVVLGSGGHTGWRRPYPGILALALAAGTENATKRVTSRAIHGQKAVNCTDSQATKLEYYTQTPPRGLHHCPGAASRIDEPAGGSLARLLWVLTEQGWGTSEAGTDIEIRDALDGLLNCLVGSHRVISENGSKERREDLEGDRSSPLGYFSLVPHRPIQSQMQLFCWLPWYLRADKYYLTLLDFKAETQPARLLPNYE